MSKMMDQEWLAKRQTANYVSAQVIQTDTNHYEINGQPFLLIKEKEQAFDREALSDRYMDILDSYDYILGDWSFDQLRLTGFYKDDVSHFRCSRSFSQLEDYLIEFCGFDCHYFILEHLRSDEEREARNQSLKKSGYSKNSSCNKSRRRNKSDKSYKNVTKKDQNRSNHTSKKKSFLVKNKKKKEKKPREGKTVKQKADFKIRKKENK
ncbi:YutD family protein [Aerococcus christensenii]|nr:YutD family protein [Aerococcus christensenii]MDK8234266.1 YutD family protein [Aerococcus christensenii]